VRVTALSEDEALRLRAGGFNLLLAPVREETAGVWDVADRLGFLVLGQVGDPHESGKLLEVLGSRPSSLGWLRPAPPNEPAAGGLPLRFGQLAGRHVDRAPVSAPPGELLVCAAELLPELAGVDNP